MKTFIYCYILLSVLFSHIAFGQKEATSVGVGNPILPGYFADPTIKKIGDTYYMYATTDGNGGGFGPSQVWTSKDFVHWAIQPMNWPNTHWYWAPDMTKGYDGRYYLYYSQPVELYGAVSDTPVGPWTSLAANDKPIVPNYMIPGVITLDGQTFTDDDGKIYMFWGTWGIYPEHGCAVGLLNEDMKTFERVELIPNTVAKDFFEAPIMFKRNGIYYLLYSSGHCEDDTYRVQYVKSKNGPFGPYEYPAENPILVTNADGTIHGPGHNGIIEENGKLYIVYHRHNNPHSGGGFHRQVAADKLEFDENGDIKKVIPTHEGIGFLAKNMRPFTDIAFGKAVEASSAYSDDFKAEFAVDNNNGTLWRAANNAGSASLTVDLEKQEAIRTVLLEMEYPTYAYQYTVEVSADGKQWTMFSDQRENNKWASPIISLGKAQARFVRLTIFNTQVVGLPRGVWNIKVYREDIGQQTIWSAAQQMPAVQEIQEDALLRLDATEYNAGNALNSVENKGTIAGKWQADFLLPIKNYQGKRAFYFDGKTSLLSDFVVPESLAGNASYTLCMWVNNPDIARTEPIISWSKPGHDLTLATYDYGADKTAGAVRHGGWADMSYEVLPDANKWQHIVLSFDGYLERLYVNGKLVKEQNKMLFVRTGEQFAVARLADDFFTGYLSSLSLMNKALTAEEIATTFQRESKRDYTLSIETADLPLGKITSLPVFGNAVQAQETVAINAELGIHDGRVALLAKGLALPALSRLFDQQHYLALFDLHDGKRWSLVAVRKEKEKISYFVNGQAATNLPFVKENQIATAMADWDISAMHSLQFFAEAKSDQDVEALYQAWQEMTKATSLKQPVLTEVMPYRINNNQVFVSVKEPQEKLTYLFRYGLQEIVWNTDAHALFDYDPKTDHLTVQAKDMYGNVGEIASFLISKEEPIAVTSLVDSFDWKKDKTLPFWDGVSLPTTADSMQVEVLGDADQWRLGSKDTKWGDEDATAPFLFKKISYDFTIEVQIGDVAGKSAGTRTSSEAGLMIRDASNPAAYINNTILTGWNLGNLTRSIGNQLFKEGNTGTGLAFEPYLQIQKIGSWFYLRSSTDGLHWEDLPNSPFYRADLATKELQVGIYQVANNNQFGYGEFKGIKLWKIAR